eukprot:6181598-Pleurochrysis_carterae.AAC.1
MGSEVALQAVGDDSCCVFTSAANPDYLPQARPPRTWSLTRPGSTLSSPQSSGSRSEGPVRGRVAAYGNGGYVSSAYAEDAVGDTYPAFATAAMGRVGGRLSQRAQGGRVIVPVSQLNRWRGAEAVSKVAPVRPSSPDLLQGDPFVSLFYSQPLQSVSSVLVSESSIASHSLSHMRARLPRFLSRSHSPGCSFQLIADVLSRAQIVVLVAGDRTGDEQARAATWQGQLLPCMFNASLRFSSIFGKAENSSRAEDSDCYGGSEGQDGGHFSCRSRC